LLIRYSEEASNEQPFHTVTHQNGFKSTIVNGVPTFISFVFYLSKTKQSHIFLGELFGLSWHLVANNGRPSA
jgi:hypothetical protein